MDWDKLRIFHAVASAGSLTHAGDSLHLSQSAVSRQIRALEESLNVVLFHRHARGLILTEQGEHLFEATASMTRRIDTAEARMRDTEDEVAGELRVTATIGFGTLWLAPRLGRLYDLYPDLSINLMLEERLLDLPMREADVAIRMKEPSQADLVRRRLMEVTIRLYATRAYLAKAPRLEKLSDLTGHRLICQTASSPQVSAGAQLVSRLTEVEGVRRLAVNNYFGILEATINDLGIGVLPHYTAEGSDTLVQVLPEEESAPVPVYLAYPEELRHAKRVEAFRDFVLAEITADRKAAQGA